MLAKRVGELPADGDWIFEPKWDGFRALIFRDGDEILIQSRDSKPLNRYFPELVEVLVAVLRGYELHDDDAIHAVRIVRAALHGFVSLEREGGFAMPIDVDESYRRLVNTLDHGLGLLRP